MGPKSRNCRAMSRRALCALLLGVVFTATSCEEDERSRYEDFCTAVIDCIGGGQPAIEACSIRHEAEEDVAAAYGCDAEWEDLADCLVDSAGKGECNSYAPNVWYSTGCGNKTVSYATCLHSMNAPCPSWDMY